MDILKTILGVVAILLLEIISIYPSLFPPTLTSQASTRVCNALALMQCIASHAETRGPFLDGIALVQCALYYSSLYSSTYTLPLSMSQLCTA